MICHHYKCIFVHIPKNAGQSIEHVFLNLLGLTWDTRAPLLLRPNDTPELGPPRLAHLKAEEYVKYKYLTQEMFDSYFKFSFVRNPWGRMISISKYLGFDKQCEFNEFVRGIFKNEIFYEMSWFVGPQSDYIYSSEGKSLIDFIGKFENLQNDFNIVCKELALPATPVPHVNQTKEKCEDIYVGLKGNIKKLLKSGRQNKFPSYKNYQDYYDKGSIDRLSGASRGRLRPGLRQVDGVVPTRGHQRRL